MIFELAYDTLDLLERHLKRLFRKLLVLCAALIIMLLPAIPSAITIRHNMHTYTPDWLPTISEVTSSEQATVQHIFWLMHVVLTTVGLGRIYWLMYDDLVGLLHGGDYVPPLRPAYIAPTSERGQRRARLRRHERRITLYFVLGFYALGRVLEGYAWEHVLDMSLMYWCGAARYGLAALSILQFCAHQRVDAVAAWLSFSHILYESYTLVRFWVVQQESYRAAVTSYEVMSENLHLNAPNMT